MANIHRLNDDQYQQLGSQPTQIINVFNQTTQNPRNDNFWTMLQSSLCPKITILSFTTLVCLIITLLYFIMLGVGGTMSNPSGYTSFFLYVDASTLQDFGANSPYKVKYEGKLYLLISSLFLIANFYYWVMSLVFIMILYSILESQFGIKSVIAIYIGGGAAGALFGDVCKCCNNGPYSEVYSSIYAGLGAMIGLIVLYWKKLDVLGQAKSMILCFVIMILILIILFSFSSEQLFYDMYGKLGGMLCGGFIAMAVINISNPGPYEKQIKNVGIGLIAFFVILNIILLYSISY